MPRMMRGAKWLAGQLSDRLSISVLYVDDSPPSTAEKKSTRLQFELYKQSEGFAGLAHASLIHRMGRERWGGLAGAVVAGFEHLQALGNSPDVILVMDGDGQHSFKTAAAMLQAMVSWRGKTRYDMINASRMVEGGTNDGLDGLWRRFVSRTATAAAKTTFPRRLAAITDPMSGCFAVRLAAIDCGRLRSANGFKINLEVAATHSDRIKRITEVPMVFLKREAGETKASGEHAMQLAKQLLRLRRATWGDKTNFLVGAGLAYCVGALLLEVLVRVGTNEVSAYWLATLASLWVNIRYNWKNTYTDGKRDMKRFSFMWVSRLLVLYLSGKLAVVLMVDGMHHQLANAIGVLAGGVANFLVTRFLLKSRRTKGKRRATRGDTRRARPLASAPVAIPHQQAHSRQEQAR